MKHKLTRIKEEAQSLCTEISSDLRSTGCTIAQIQADANRQIAKIEADTRRKMTADRKAHNAKMGKIKELTALTKGPITADTLQQMQTILSK